MAIFLTLGPEGSCHENAVKHYHKFHGFKHSEIQYILNFHSGLEILRTGQVDFLVQCSAHPLVHQITEKYFKEVFVLDTFVFPTKPLALLERIDVPSPKSLGLVKATEGYLSKIEYDEVVYEASKPIIGKKLLEGAYDAGLTHLEYFEENPSELKVKKMIGEVVTTWIVYARSKCFDGTARGVLPPGELQEHVKSESK